MPKLFNLDHSPVVVNRNERAVLPGESHDFTDEEIAAGLAGLWGDEDPRKGLKAEREFKRKRDAKARAPQTTEPAAEPDNKKE